MTATAVRPDAREPPEVEPAQVGMWVFLSSEMLFFGPVFLAYAYGRSHWPAGFAAASRETDVVIGTLNTALLLTSSALVALAAAFAPTGRRRPWVAPLLAGACVLGIAFLALKGVEYAKEWNEHLVPGAGFKLRAERGAELFYMLYFFSTSLHAVHLTVGIGVLGAFAWGTHGMKRWARPQRVEAAGLYWHFVDVVWIFLYPLLYLVERHS